jgi:hypothetical protein
MDDGRTERMQRRFVVPVTVAALLVIPSMLLNRTSGDPTLGLLAEILNVGIWLVPLRVDFGRLRFYHSTRIPPGPLWAGFFFGPAPGAVLVPRRRKPLHVLSIRRPAWLGEKPLC